MKYVFSILIFFCVSQMNAQNKPEYAVNLIADSLVKNAAEVIREDVGVFEMRSPKDATYKTRMVITVFKETHPHNYFSKGYNRERKIKVLHARYYDAAGKLIRKVEKDEIKDVAAQDGFSLYLDERIKYLENNYGVLPYTFEIECDEQLSSFLQFPEFNFQRFDESVEHSEYSIVAPTTIKISHRVVNSNLKPDIKINDKGQQVLKWEVNNLKAVQSESFAPAGDKIFPHVEAQADKFSFYDVEGDMSSWAGFGKFEAQINRDRDKLSPEMEKKVHLITEFCKTDREKIDTLYHYLQKNYRYVSVQLGIGGFQTFDAAYVEKNKYGDCKALSNYMQALLKSAGIKANSAVVCAGRKDYFDPDPNFCYDRFNHVILHIPSENMWLECTSDDLPTGYLSTFTQNRGALVFDDVSGKIMRTPALDTTSNVETTKTTLQLAADGSAVFKSKSIYAGSLQDELRSYIKNSSKDDLQKAFQKNKRLPSFKIEKLDYAIERNKPEVSLDCVLRIEKLGAKAGSRVIVPINQDNAFNDTPPATEKRQFQIDAGGSGYTENLEVTLEIPDGLRVESLPTEKTEWHSVYGSYVSAIEKTEKSVVFKRQLVIKPVSQPAEKFNEFREFYKKMQQADGAKVILKAVADIKN